MPKPSKNSPSTTDLKTFVLWRWYSLCSAYHNTNGAGRQDPDNCPACSHGFWMCVTHLKEECEECPDG